MAMLKKYQSYVAINLRGRKELFQWKIDNKVVRVPYVGVDKDNPAEFSKK